MSRSQFYEYKRAAFYERGLEGLFDRSRIPNSCPHETSPELRKRSCLYQ
ncbi:MAG: hypothetical protein J7L08_01515 [Candidatus Aenigmarchaeota archaeon]|nr:hypothetical protein [Candidatus Aenigmarchaeota archaeon]